MTWRALISGDKTPLIIAFALTVFGWYVDSISKYFAEQAVIYVTSENTSVKDEYLVKNLSLNKTIKTLSIDIRCVPTSNCLTSKPAGSNQFGTLEQLAPFAISGTQSCFQNEAGYEAQISLSPGASVKLGVNKSNESKTDLFIAGHFTSACDTINNDLADNIRVEQYPSAIAFLLQNFILYYFVSIIVLLCVFVITIWRLIATPTEGADNEPKTVVVDITLRLDDKSTFGPGR